MIHEVRTMDELWNREIPLISEDVSFDPNRDQLDGVKTVATSGGLSPLAFLTGPVEAVYNGDPGDTYVHEKLQELIDYENGIVRSITEELELNYKEGIFTFDSPAAAGVSGFLGTDDPIELTDVTIESGNDYVTVGVISMDGLPLTESGKILIQTGTTYRPTGWKEVEEKFVSGGDTVEGYRIIDTGRMPWVAAPTNVEVTINNVKITKAWLLNLAGYPIKELKLRKLKDKRIIELPPDALYVVLNTN